MFLRELRLLRDCASAFHEHEHDRDDDRVSETSYSLLALIGTVKAGFRGRRWRRPMKRKERGEAEVDRCDVYSVNVLGKTRKPEKQQVGLPMERVRTRSAAALLLQTNSTEIQIH